MTAEERKIFLAAINKFGVVNQCIVAIEELSELQKALTKYLRGQADLRHIAEEAADVQIMLDQLQLMFSFFPMTDALRLQKIGRLEDMLAEQKKVCATCAYFGPDADDVPICHKFMKTTLPCEGCGGWEGRR